jgi:hypothetical protein
MRRIWTLFGAWKAAALESGVRAIIEETREVGSELESDPFKASIDARLRCLVRRTPDEIEVATTVLRNQVATLLGELTQLNEMLDRADMRGMLAWRVRATVRRRIRRIVRDVSSLREQALENERTCDQLEQWLMTRAQIVLAEYQLHQGRALRLADASHTEMPIEPVSPNRESETGLAPLSHAATA